jgi:hemoglobin/transferrin/lactoferrin receptor protein
VCISIALAVTHRAHDVRAAEPMGSEAGTSRAVDTLAPPPPARDSLPAPASPADSASLPAPRPITIPRHHLGVADTVTVLPALRVEADRPRGPERTAATRTRLDRSDLVRFQPSNVSEALLGVPGLEVARTGPWSSSVSLRGLSGERVLVLVDGVRLQSGRGHGAQMSLVSVDRLESVEVLPGASGVQYGSDALGGVVEFSTHRDLVGPRQATLMLTGRTAGPGNERSGRARLRLVGPIVGAEVSAGLGALDALVTPAGRVPHSSFHEGEWTARAQAKLAGGTFDLERTQHTARDILVPAFDDDAGSHAEYPLQERIAHRLEWKLPGSGLRPELGVLGIDQTFLTSFDETTVDSVFVRGRFAALRTTGAADRIDTRSFGLQPTAQWSLLKFSGEYRHERTKGPRTTDVAITNTSGQQTSSTRSEGESVPPARRDVLSGRVFAPLTWKTLRFELGARYDWLHSHADSTPASFTPILQVTDRRWSFEGGAAWSVSHWQPYARVASGFRAPNLEERYFDDGFHGGMRLFGNPDLTAERARTLELGVRTGEAGWGMLQRGRVSVYRSDVDELITLRYLGQLYLIPRFQYTNVHRAVLEGAELQAECGVGAWRFNATAAAPRGRDAESGDPIPDLGATRVSVDVRRSLPWTDVPGGVALRARWTDASGKGDPELARPAYWAADAEASVIAWGTRFTAAVRNLTDTRYREPLGFIDEPGRHLALSVRHERSLRW